MFAQSRAYSIAHDSVFVGTHFSKDTAEILPFREKGDCRYNTSICPLYSLKKMNFRSLATESMHVATGPSSSSTVLTQGKAMATEEVNGRRLKSEHIADIIY